MKFVSAQFVYFFEKPLEAPADKLSVELRERTKLFSQPPLIIPLPTAAPAQFPFIHFQQNNYKLTISRERVDFFYTALSKAENEDFPFHHQELENHINNIFESLKLWEKIIRMGYIITYFHPKESPTEHIKSVYLKKDLGSINEINIRFNQYINLQALSLNNVTKIDPAEMVAPSGEQEEGLLVTKDINSVSTIKYDFDTSLLTTFLNHAKKYLYFKEVEKTIK